MRPTDLSHIGLGLRAPRKAPLPDIDTYAPPWRMCAPYGSATMELAIAKGGVPCITLRCWLA